MYNSKSCKQSIHTARKIVYTINAVNVQHQER